MVILYFRVHEPTVRFKLACHKATTPNVLVDISI